MSSDNDHEVTVLNPEAIGDPDQTPLLQLPPAVVAALNPCKANAPSRDGYCGGVNGFHAFDCPTVPAGEVPR